LKIEIPYRRALTHIRGHLDRRYQRKQAHLDRIAALLASHGKVQAEGSFSIGSSHSNTGSVESSGSVDSAVEGVVEGVVVAPELPEEPQFNAGEGLIDIRTEEEFGGGSPDSNLNVIEVDLTKSSAPNCGNGVHHISENLEAPHNHVSIEGEFNFHKGY
jgi:hypothetical protein